LATETHRGNADRLDSSQLAIKGGRPVVAPGDVKDVWPVVSEEDIAAVTATLRSGKLTWANNETVAALERAWADYVGSRYCIAFNSGTSALHGAVAAVGVEPGDEVIVPALSFLASAAAVVHHQGLPVFVDVDPQTFLLDPALLAEQITDRTRAVMAVHLSGLTAPMDEILAVTQPRGIKVIEDLSQAAGARYKGRKVGSIGDVGGCSIMAGKNLPTAGEGGLLTTDQTEMRNRADRLKMFGNHISASGEREFSVATLGWNYRFSSILASFTMSQLKRLDEHTLGVQEGARYLSAGMAEIPGLLPPLVPEGSDHVYHHFRFRIDPEAAGIDLPVGRFRRALQDLVTAEGVPLKTYQNMPLAGHWLFQEQRGCPFNCEHASRKIRYDIHDYPRTLDIIRSSLLIGNRLCMGTFFERRHLDLYLEAFRKVLSHRDELVSYGRALEYREPWEEHLKVA
jgi:dTDP-4-amino-4,6-dideoxygalactose transaminase